MSDKDKIGWLKERLLKPLPGRGAQELMGARVKPMPDVLPENARASAVLSLLFLHNDHLHTLLIQRTDDGKAHSGQISFPGGRYESSDGDLVTTALREANEEVGIAAADVEILGGLTPLYIPVSNFIVHPFIGYSGKQLFYTPSSNEVARTIEVPLEELLHPERKAKVEVTSPVDKTFRRTVPAYRLNDGTIIWGATAMIFSELQVLFEEYK